MSDKKELGKMCIDMSESIAEVRKVIGRSDTTAIQVTACLTLLAVQGAEFVQKVAKHVDELDED